MTLQRAAGGPLLTRRDISDLAPEIVDPSSVFNPGAVRIDGCTHLLLRVQTRGRRSYLVPASETDDGRWYVAGRPTELQGLDEALRTRELHVFHIYDARLSRIDQDLLVVTALDTDRGGRLAIWRAVGAMATHAGLDRLELVGLTGDHDTRNGVLFPLRMDGRYLMLERPNHAQPSGGPPTGDTICLCGSPDLQQWQDLGPVLSGRPHYWDERVGSGPPPLLTEAGWLHLYHGVATHFQSANIYQAGAVLLDRHDPTQVLGRTADNILEPRVSWELIGQVPNVVFPSGMTVNKVTAEGCAAPDAMVDVYYGAADTVVGKASARVGDLIKACLAGADNPQDPNQGADRDR